MNPNYELREKTAWIGLDDGKANAMRTDGLRSLGAALDRAEKDEATGIVIRGRDGMFSAGLDLKWIPTLDPEGGRELVEVFASTMLRVLMSPIPTLALVSGHAIAGGCVLACACDRRIGVKGDYRIQMNEVAIGIPMPSWMRLIVSSAIPAPRLYDVLLLAEPLSVSEAHALGTLRLLSDDFEALDAAGASTASAFAGLDREAFARTKTRLWGSQAEQAREALERE